jgi:hypothetical protein
LLVSDLMHVIEATLLFSVLPYIISIFFYMLVFLPLYFIDRDIKYYSSLQMLLIIFLFILGKYLLPYFVV